MDSTSTRRSPDLPQLRGAVWLRRPSRGRATGTGPGSEGCNYRAGAGAVCVGGVGVASVLSPPPPPTPPSCVGVLVFSWMSWARSEEWGGRRGVQSKKPFEQVCECGGGDGGIIFAQFVRWRPPLKPKRRCASTTTCLRWGTPPLPRPYEHPLL